MDTIEIEEGSSSSLSSDDEKPVIPTGYSTAGINEEGSGCSSGTDNGGVVEFEDVKDIKPKKRKKLTKKELRRRMKTRRDNDRLALKIPNIVTDREKERALLKTATIGVVHLFNAVSERQKEVEEKLIQSGKKLRKYEKIEALKKFNSSDFHNRLDRIGKVKNELEPNGASLELDNDENLSDMDISGIKTEPESDGE